MLMRGQQPNKENLLAWIDQVSFAVNEMNLYLDTHPEDEEAMAFFREKLSAGNLCPVLWASDHRHGE